MPKKTKTVKVQRPAKDGSDTLIEVEYTDSDWALINAYFDCNMNQTRAYLSVFKDAKYESARVEASKFFARPNIRSEITYRLDQDAMSAAEVLKRLGDIARASHYPFIRIDQDGFIYFDFSDPEALNHLHLIKKIKTKRERRIDGTGEDAQEWEGEWVGVELHDAAAALRDIGRYHAMFTDNTKISGEIELVRKRVGVDVDKI